MKPRTKMQKEVAELSKGLPSITKSQREYAFKKCIKHYAYTVKNKASCLECGHQWKGEYKDGEKCVCPNCGQELTTHQTRCRVYKQTDYYCVLTTKKQYQVIRFYEVKVRCKIGEKAKYYIYEVVQRWIDPNGKNAIVARLRSMSFLYSDLWAVNSPMEIRRENQYDVYDIYPYIIYPRMKIIPQIKRNGFTGEFYELTPFSMFDAILNNRKLETVLKAGQTELFKYSINRRMNLKDYWPSIKICIRNGYFIEDASMWRDHIDMLKYLGKDIRNPKYVCPKDFSKEHDKIIKQRNRQLVKEELQRSFDEIQKYEDEYRKSKERFFDFSATDGLINLNTLKSVKEFVEEGTHMHHCVYAGKYYMRDDSLILSATIGGERIETVEVNLKTFNIVQSRGVCNQNTEYHDRIIELVNKNMNQIKAVV